MNDKVKPIRIFLADSGEVVSAPTAGKINLLPSEAEENEPTDWTPKSYEFTGEVFVNKKDADRLRSLVIFTRSERRKMFHAVTHGKAIAFVANFECEGYENVEAPVCITRPRELRKILSMCHGFRFDYAIVPAAQVHNAILRIDNE